MSLVRQGARATKTQSRQRSKRVRIRRCKAELRIQNAEPRTLNCNLFPGAGGGQGALLATPGYAKEETMGVASRELQATPLTCLRIPAGTVGADLRAVRREPSCQPGTGRLGDPALPTPQSTTRYRSIASTTSSWREIRIQFDCCRLLCPNSESRTPNTELQTMNGER